MHRLTQLHVHADGGDCRGRRVFRRRGRALALIGLEGRASYCKTKAAPWVQTYKWAILCFVAVGVWNTVGAGLRGFAINPPISLYYVRGLNMTPAHGHAALFDVYGMFGIGLMLF